MTRSDSRARRFARAWWGPSLVALVAIASPGELAAMAFPAIEAPLPGPTLIQQSEDEQVTRDVLLEEDRADVVQVGDLKNLRRTLLLTSQLAEYGVPFTLCLNMSDEATDLGITVNSEALSEVLGVAV